MRTFVVINRKARHLARDGEVLRALQASRRLGAIVHETRSLEELEDVARKAAAANAEAVVLAGGDGSYMAGVSALFRAMAPAMPAVAFAPGGTASTVARNFGPAWGLRTTAAHAAERLVRAALAGEPALDRATLRARDDTGRDHVGFIFGAGLVASFFDVYYASSTQGYAGAARIVARVFAGSFVGGALASRVLTPVPLTLTIDGEEQPPRAYSLVVASVVQNLGLGMKPAYRAGERFDRVHVVASAQGPRALGPQMPRVLLGLPLRGDENVDAMASRIELAFTSERAAYVLDGDVFRAKSVRVAPGPIIRVIA